MSSGIDWEYILRDRYPVYDSEKVIFVTSFDLMRSLSDCAKLIYTIIKNDASIPNELKMIYHEGLYGKHDRVKRRMRNRISHIKRQLR